MSNFINFLPPWVETNIQPAFYDKESGTCIQQTARMYNKVNELVRIANEQNVKIDDFINMDVHAFLDSIIKEYIDDGTFYETLAYDPSEESLTLTFDIARA